MIHYYNKQLLYIKILFNNNKIQKIDTEVFATYGMTETITHIAVKKLNHIRLAELDSASQYFNPKRQRD